MYVSMWLASSDQIIHPSSTHSVLSLDIYPNLYPHCCYILYIVRMQSSNHSRNHQGVKRNLHVALVISW